MEKEKSHNIDEVLNQFEGEARLPKGTADWAKPFENWRIA
jgi:hypothetical protein